MKRAVIFYSLSGNTREAAEYVAKELEAELIEITLDKPMPKNFKMQILKGGMQVTFGMKPKIKGMPANVDFDEIILGTPIWAGKSASPINTLLAISGIRDKVIGIFTFSGGGDNEGCISQLSKLLPNMKCQVALADRKNKLSSENKAKLEMLVNNIKA